MLAKPIRYLAVFLALAVAVPLAHADGDERLRKFADEMAELILKDQREALYEQFAPSLRQAYSKAELLQPLALSHDENGKILSYDFRVVSVGWREVSGVRIRTAEYTYAAATSRYPRGRYLKVETTYMTGRFYLAGYSIIHFIGTDEPDFLKPKTPNPAMHRTSREKPREASDFERCGKAQPQGCFETRKST